MPIWEYVDSSRDTSIESVSTSCCIFCNTNLDIISYDKGKIPVSSMGHSYFVLGFCPGCGWWRVHSHFDDMWSSTKNIIIDKGAAGSLNELNLTDISTPIKEVTSYLTAKYESRFTLSPRLFEETVGSVFRDLDYDVVVTAYSNDGGIDAVLIDEHGSKIGVQVKRWKNTINVEQIRAFAGALILGNYTKGIYVTTSDFQSGTKKAIKTFKMRGYPIELMNAERFYDALKITQKKAYQRPKNIEPYLKKLKEIRNESIRFPGP